MSREELEKLTATKLREIAKEYEEITGASAMKKEDLVVAILRARGEPVKVVKKDETKMVDIKQRIAQLKKERDAALQEKDAKKAGSVRKELKKLKRKSRQLANIKASPQKGAEA